MSSSTLEKLRSEALSLPEAERAELARSLVESLDGRQTTMRRRRGTPRFLRRLAESIPVRRN
jgi:hypothetical protein